VSNSRRWASIAQTADYLGLSDKTIRNWIAAGTIRAYRAGSKVIRIDLDELDAMLKPVGGAR